MNTSIMMTRALPILRSLLIAGAAACTMLPAAHAITLYGQTSDARVNFTDPSSGTDGGGTVSNVTGTLASGGNGATPNVYAAAIFVFQLPDLGAVVNPFTTAQFSFTINATNSVDAFNSSTAHDLYGLGARSSSAVLADDFYTGGLDSTDATLIANNIVTGSNTTRFASNVTKTTTGNNLLNYLNTQYAGGANAGQYVFLRLNYDSVNSNATQITLHSSDSTTNDTLKPQIEYIAVPEPGVAGMLMLGAGLVAVRRAKRRLV